MINGALQALLMAFMHLLTSAGYGPIQDAPTRPWPMSVSEEAFEAMGNAGYLAVVLNLIDREAEALASEMFKDLYLQILAERFAYVGEQAHANIRSDQVFGEQFIRASQPRGRELPPVLQGTSALEAIVAAAADRQLVMVNEEHRSSVQRAFSNRLLEPLRNLGFSYLAVETISEEAADLNDRGYPVMKTGTYTKDPVFGDLIRRALELGYRVIPYEAGSEELRPRPDDASPLDRMNRRERAQAHNIFEQTFKLNPGAKVFVVGGRDHIAEGSGDQWTPMGGVLKNLSGLDPLTINQSVMVEHSEREFEPWPYIEVEEAGWLADEPVLLVMDDGRFWSRSPGSLDAYLFHPRTRCEKGRPHWMAMGGLRKPVEFECPEAESPLLLQAIVQGESDDAIPLDQSIWWPDQPRPALFLRRGSYILRAIDRDGRVVFSRDHRVE